MILRANALHYHMPKNLSVVESQAQCVYRSDSQKANSGQILRVTFQSGAAFVNSKDSYAKFKWKATLGDASAKITTPHIGALACFNSVRMLSRAGTEIYRVTDWGLFLTKWLVHTRSDNWWTQVAPSFHGSYPKDSKAPTLAHDTEYAAAFPLELLYGPFQDINKLIPSHLISGATLEFQINDVVSAFVYDKDPGASYLTVSDFEVIASLCTLSESAERALDRAASTNGLETCFSGIATSTTSTTNNFNEIHIQKACSRASFLFSCVRPTSNLIAYDKDAYDSLIVGGKAPYTRTQVRHGSQYQPTQAASVDAPQLIHLFNSLQFSHVNAAKKVDDYANSIVSQSLERSPLLKYSGVSSNNSRQISHLFEGNFATTAGGCTVTSFLIYDVLARTSLEHTVISE